MFWKRMNRGNIQYVAVVKMTRVDQDRALYGQEHYLLELADGTTEHFTFEQVDAQAWQKFVGNGGMVINPRAGQG